MLPNLLDILRDSSPSRSRTRHSSGARALLVAALALACALGAATRAHAFGLGVRVDFDTPGLSTGLAYGDLNGDGATDLVTANDYNSTVSVFLGDGHGGFGPHIDYPTGTSPFSIALEDMNGDGRLDLVVACGSGVVSVMLGSGTGGFGPHVDYPAGTNSRSVALGDLNGDGRLDAVVANYASSTITVLLGNGAGGFAPKVDIPAASGPYSIALGDENGDGRLDMAVANYGGSSVSVFPGNGAGGFGARTDYTLPAPGTAMALGDVNNDGKLDLVAGSYPANVASVFLGNGTGGFGARADYAVGNYPNGVAIADLDGDGRADLAVSNYLAGTVSVLNGQAVGFGTKTDFPCGSFGGANPYAIVATDLNGDGRVDVAVTDFSDRGLSVLFGAGAVAYGSRTDFTGVRSIFGHTAVAVGDLNGDGRPDVAFGATFAPNIVTALGDGAGGFGPVTDVATSDLVNNVTALSIRDMNGDGHNDLVASGALWYSAILFGNGTGGFGPDSTYRVGGQVMTLSTVDVSGDGRPDIVTYNGYDNTVSVLLAAPSGGYNTTTLFSPRSRVPLAMAVGDLNGDHLPDLACTVASSDSVYVLLGTGGGGFGSSTAWVSYPCGPAPHAIALGDLNGDGKLDVVTANNSGTVSVLSGDGAGGLLPRTDYGAGNAGNAVTVADLDGDGRPDVLVGRVSGGASSLFLGDGRGGLGPQYDLAPLIDVNAIVPADFDGDGRTDLAVGAGTSLGSTLVALGRTRVSLAASPSPVTLGAPIVLTATVSVAAPGAGTPTGTVRFYDGTTLLGSAPLSGGSAALVVFAGALGTRAYSAVYAGDGKRLGSVSAPRTAMVVASASPMIASIRDVPADQGGNVRLRFRASGYDFRGSTTPITNYAVYRQVAPGAAPPPPPVPAAARRARPNAVLLDGWDFLATVPATVESAYVVVAPTLADSGVGGFHRATFLVRALTSSPSVYWDSAPDSGYSVDNLPPATPTPFLGVYAAGATHLHWGRNTEPDFWCYKVYRGSSSGFTPGPANLVASTSDTGYVDAGASGSTYKLSAVDANGNESPVAVLTGSNTASTDGPALPASLALSTPLPNPASHDALMRFALPRDAGVSLRIFDLGGRQVRELALARMAAGEHALTWDLRDAAGASVPGGLYFVRLTADGQSRVQRLAVVH